MSYFHFHAEHHHPPRVSRRHFVFLGMLTPVAIRAQSQRGSEPAPPAKTQQQTRRTPTRQVRKARIFDAHLHCPSDAGEVWQWHPVTRTFEESAAYLDRSGVQKGIINSVRSQMAKDV